MNSNSVIEIKLGIENDPTAMFISADFRESILPGFIPEATVKLQTQWVMAYIPGVTKLFTHIPGSLGNLAKQKPETAWILTDVVRSNIGENDNWDCECTFILDCFSVPFYRTFEASPMNVDAASSNVMLKLVLDEYYAGVIPDIKTTDKRNWIFTSNYTLYDRFEEVAKNSYSSGINTWFINRHGLLQNVNVFNQFRSITPTRYVYNSISMTRDMEQFTNMMLLDANEEWEQKYYVDLIIRNKVHKSMYSVNAHQFNQASDTFTTACCGLGSNSKLKRNNASLIDMGMGVLNGEICAKIKSEYEFLYTLIENKYVHFKTSILQPVIIGERISLENSTGNVEAVVVSNVMHSDQQSAFNDVKAVIIN